MLVGWVNMLVLAGLLTGMQATQVDAPSPNLLVGDAVRGKAVYTQCVGCHSPERHRTGPKHCGLIGRKAGAAIGYAYSKVMQHADVVWSEQTLDQFLYAPLSFMPGIKMGVAGIKDDRERADLIAYLMTMNGQPECN